VDPPVLSFFVTASAKSSGGEAHFEGGQSREESQHQQQELEQRLASAASGRKRFLVISIAGAAVVGNGFVAFKLQTNAAKRFNVHPAQGYLPCGNPREGKVKITIQLRSGQGWSPSDKFLVRAVPVQGNEVPVQDVWKKLGRDYKMQKIVVRCDYLVEDSKELVEMKEESLRSNMAPSGLAPPTSPITFGSSAHGKRTSKGQIPQHIADLLVKNLSRKPEDKLTVAQLEELQKLKESVGVQEWNRLQEDARQRRDAGALQNRESIAKLIPPPSSSTLSLATDLLTQGVELLDSRRLREAVSKFKECLGLALPSSVNRAQALVGLGSAYEETGKLDVALACYMEALKIYNRLNDRTCKESVCNAIAHVHSDMRDHAMAAAWFDEELHVIDDDPVNGSRKSTIMIARDHQMKIGGVSPTIFSQAKSRVATLSRSIPDVDISRLPDVDTLAARNSVSETVETLWEPSVSPKQYLAQSPEHRPSPAPISSSETPHYLAETTASKASRFVPTRNRKPDSPPPAPSSQPQIAVQRSSERGKQATAQHVKRSLEARRLRDQNMGKKPPSARKLGRQESFNGMVYLAVECDFDGETYSIALPGPLESAGEMTIREMRERVSFVTGVNMHDFELAVEGVPLADSWTGRDIGIGTFTRLDLRLLPGVRQEKYVRPKSSPSRAAQIGNEEEDISGSDQSKIEVTGIPRPPSRPPPPPLDDDDDDDESQEHEPDGKMTGSPSGRIYEAYQEDDEDFEDLQSIFVELETTLESQKEADQLADELGAQALKLLGGDGDLNEVEETEGERIGEKLMKQVTSLERKLAQSEEKCSRLDKQLHERNFRIADGLIAKGHTEAAKKELQERVKALKNEHEAFVQEAKTALASFEDVLWKNIQSIQRLTSVRKRKLFFVTENAEKRSQERRTYSLDSCKTRFLAEGAFLVGEVEDFAPLMESLRQVNDDFRKNLLRTAYFVSFETPGALLSHRGALMQRQVELFTRSIDSGADKFKVQAVSVDSVTGGISDLLDPVNQRNENPISLSVTWENGMSAVRLQGAVGVHFHNEREFSKLQELMLDREWNQVNPSHFVLVLEHEASSKQVVLLELCVWPDPYEDQSDTELSETMTQILKACSDSNAEVLVFAGMDSDFEHEPGEEFPPLAAQTILETFFQSLCVRSR